MTKALQRMPTVIENRVSPEARIGASEIIAQPLSGSVTIWSASGSAAIVATVASNVKTYARGQAKSAVATPVNVVVTN